MPTLNDITNCVSIPPNQPNTSHFFIEEPVSSISLNLCPEDDRKVRLGDLLEKANNGIFLQKKIIFGKSEKPYSSIYNFFDFQTIFDIKPKNKIKFICLFV